MSIQKELSSLIQDIPNFPKEGVVFKDINPLLRNPTAMRKVISYMAEHASGLGAQHIIGIESRGFFFALPLALELNLPFVAARKKGKLPGKVVQESYNLEYGTDAIEIQSNALHSQERYFIVDDVIATGGTATACANIVQKCHAQVVGFSFLIELGFLNGSSLLHTSFPSARINSLLHI